MKTTASLLAAGALAIGLAFPLAAAAKDKISYAYLIDPALEGVLYGIKSGKVTSPTVDIVATPLPIPALIQSTTTKQYDVVMNAVLSIPRALDEGLKMEMLSTALRSVASPVSGGMWVKSGSPYKTLADLKGKTVGDTALQSTGTTWTRIALWKAHQVNVSYDNGDYKWVQMPATELLGALQTDHIEAANLIHLQAFQAIKSGDYRSLLPTAKDIVELFHVNQVSAVNVAYPERIDAHPDDYKEFDRMIKASVDYANEHTDEVGKAIADQFHIAPEFFGWWLKDYSIFPGDVSAGDLRSMEVVWENAKALGLMGNYPKAESVVWKDAIRE
ncbi:MAG TPA: ABC transporter substrate-binding protein [Stellaceae bacterium]|nr:ABC transporter substrate-binding protein [Stellaceae bacterium]